MLTLTIIAFALNLTAAVINTVVGIHGKSTFNIGCAMFNWVLTGYFLASLVQGSGS